VTLRLVPTVDTTTKWPVEFFVHGDRYKLWGWFESDIHLFGVEGKGAFVHLLGTDQLGRDMFSRLLYATRTSLSVGAIGVLLSFVLGIMFGGIAGYFGGMVDNLIMRTIEFIRSIPTLPLWLALAAALPRDWTALQVYISITAILAVIGWTHLARRVRGKLLSLREEDFVLAARLSGCSHTRIVVRHMLPSFMSYMIVDLTISFPYIIMAETALSFLGLGMREPIVSWGVLLYSAQNIRSMILMPWLLIPGLVVIIAVIAFNFLGDGMRDAADPYST
jgi:peptide/nickel transport system permease protein